MKYYKWDRIYYKTNGKQLEKVYALRHCYGIEVTDHFTDIDNDPDFVEITENQYLRVRKIILAKIQQS